MITIRESLSLFYDKHRDWLETQYPGISMRRLETEMITCLRGHFYRSEVLDSPYLPEYDTFFEPMLEGVPLEYISGRAYFYKSEFQVNEHTLIPRSETEILVEMIVNAHGDSSERLRVVDIGTGTGAIILSLAQEFSGSHEFIGSDISPMALTVAQRNSFFLQYNISPKHDVDFLLSDRLEKLEGEFDIIVSNPPYIKRIEDRAQVHPQVVEYEPHEALFLDDNEYDSWFKDFFCDIFKHLKNDGTFYMEGHECHLQEQKNWLEVAGFDSVKVVQDYTGRDRFLVARKN